jgi:ATP-binding protein involved in chromosome partitioning
MKDIPIISAKGGVGKSLVTCLTANAAMQLGFKVGIADLDITGPSVLKYLNLKQRDAELDHGMLKPLVSNGIEFMSASLFFDNDDQPVLVKGKTRARMVQQFLDKVKWNCEYLVLDCPPGGTDELNYLLKLRKKDIHGVIIVATPSDVAMTQVRKSIALCQRLQVPILGIVSNMTEYQCPQCKFRTPIFADGQDPVKLAAEQFNVKILAKLPIVKNIENNPLFFTPHMRVALEGAL